MLLDWQVPKFSQPVFSLPGRSFLLPDKNCQQMETFRCLTHHPKWFQSKWHGFLPATELEMLTQGWDCRILYKLHTTKQSLAEMHSAHPIFLVICRQPRDIVSSGGSKKEMQGSKRHVTVTFSPLSCAITIHVSIRRPAVRSRRCQVRSHCCGLRWSLWLLARPAGNNRACVWGCQVFVNLSFAW